MKNISIITSMTIRILIIFLVIIQLVSILELGTLIARVILYSDGIYAIGTDSIPKERLFLPKVQGLISAVLLITILMELIASLVAYLNEGSANYVKIIVEIALIALLRHLLGIDIEHVDSGTLLGISSLLLVLGGFYYLLKKLPSSTPSGPNEKV